MGHLFIELSRQIMSVSDRIDGTTHIRIDLHTIEKKACNNIGRQLNCKHKVEPATSAAAIHFHRPLSRSSKSIETVVDFTLSQL